MHDQGFSLIGPGQVHGEYKCINAGLYSINVVECSILRGWSELPRLPGHQLCHLTVHTSADLLVV